MRMQAEYDGDPVRLLVGAPDGVPLAVLDAGGADPVAQRRFDQQRRRRVLTDVLAVAGRIIVGQAADG